MYENILMEYICLNLGKFAYYYIKTFKLLLSNVLIYEYTCIKWLCLAALLMIKGRVDAI